MDIRRINKVERCRRVMVLHTLNRRSVLNEDASEPTGDRGEIIRLASPYTLCGATVAFGIETKASATFRGASTPEAHSGANDKTSSLLYTIVSWLVSALELSSGIRS